MRHSARASGELATISGQRSIVRGEAIVLESVDPRFVYVPGGGVFDVGAFDSFDWAWQRWHVDWKAQH